MIDKSLFYKFIYVSVSFQDNPAFVKGLKTKFKIEIPYVDLDNLNRSLKESLDSYFYIENNEDFVNTYKLICKKYPKVSFTVLGNIRGKDIFSFFNTCKLDNIETFKVGDRVKVIEGELKNLSAKVSAVDKESVEIEFPLLNGTKRIVCKISELILNENYTPFEASKFKSLEKKFLDKGLKYAVVVDGNNCLLRSMRNIPDKYNSNANYVGGFIGFYFSLLKLKEMYPEFSMHVAFNLSSDAFGYLSDKAKKAIFSNMSWCKRFVEEIGFYCHYSFEHQEKDILGSLLLNLQEEYSQILVYSTNTILQSLVNDKVTIFYPKTTFRGNSEFIGKEQILTKYEVNRIDKVLWYLGFVGDSEGIAKSLAQVYAEIFGPKQGKIKPSEFTPAINNSKDESELLTNIEKEPKLVKFLPQLQKNLNLLKINRNLQIQTTKKDLNNASVKSVLEEVEMYKEVEIWDRSERIFKGLW